MKMTIGVPKEIKKHEYRVGLTPAAVASLTNQGHMVFVQASAGLGSGYQDNDYAHAGASVVEDSKAIWQKADIVVKVKEPQAEEFPLIRPQQILFTFFHFAACEALTQAIQQSRCTAIAYETIELPGGSLPILTPMSEVAGRMSVIQGAYYLQKQLGGKGKLISGVPGVEPARVVIIGGGVVGLHAAKMAAGMGAKTTILDINLERLRYLSEIMPANVTPLVSNSQVLERCLTQADLVINAILVPGAKAPKLITRKMLQKMEPGSVVVDVAIDQGGGLETSRPTDHENPIYFEEGILHYCVANIPGAVPQTSTQALVNTTYPYLKALANYPLAEAIAQMPGLAYGVNMIHGDITYKAVAEAFNLPYTPLNAHIKRGF